MALGCVPSDRRAADFVRDIDDPQTRDPNEDGKQGPACESMPGGWHKCTIASDQPPSWIAIREMFPLCVSGRTTSHAERALLLETPSNAWAEQGLPSFTEAHIVSRRTINTDLSILPVNWVYLAGGAQFQAPSVLAANGDARPQSRGSAPKDSAASTGDCLGSVRYNFVIHRTRPHLHVSAAKIHSSPSIKDSLSLLVKPIGLALKCAARTNGSSGA